MSPGRGRTRAAGLSDAVPFAEAARLLGVSVRTVYRLVNAGHLRPFRLPGSDRPRIPLDQVVMIRARTDASLRAATGRRGPTREG